MTEIAISEFKAKCIALLKNTQRTGEPLIVTLRGKPLVKINAAAAPHKRRLGGQKGALVVVAGHPNALIESDLDKDWAS